MKTRIVLLSVPLVALLSGCTSGPSFRGSSAGKSEPASDATPRRLAINPKLREELTAMSKSDQEVRQALIAAGMNPPNEELMAKMTRIDSTNTIRMKELVRKYGWPGKSLVGDDGETAAFLLAQHADRDPAFQKEVLALLREAHKSGEVSGEHLALLTDRVLISEGKPQLYGSQADIVDGKIVVKPVEDETNLNKRRAALGLPSMNEYMERMRTVYGLPAQKP